MIYREKIVAALNMRRSEFIEFESGMREQFSVYRDALDGLASVSGAELIERLRSGDSPGALPTEEFDRARTLVIPFEQQWSNHEQAREWAFETLLGRTTFAADGSQILPTKDFSVPVAAIQVAWFENRHAPGGDYVKDASFEILTPAEVMVRTGGATEVSEQIVHRRRYGLELGAIRNYMKATAERGIDLARPPIVFLDSLLVISFAELLPDEQRQFYVSEIISLLDASKKTGIPVVGYIDTSFARDLINMLQAAFELPAAERLHDAGLVSQRMKWGDRSPLFRCARRGILDTYGDEWRRQIGFLYLKTASDTPPSRLDMPLWVYERGLLDYVVDTVRGEVVVGNGYPYSIEAADATAVLTTRDREMFYAIFQEFAQRERLDLRIAHKAISKANRR
ncbi:MAG TPA: DNA double-strand break repair nuclease NurA [Blastocatellia bacterium]|nr:DNA double-strand break repair nuclease NurA [Blastocatellia bacterium]